MGKPKEINSNCKNNKAQWLCFRIIYGSHFIKCKILYSGKILFVFSFSQVGFLEKEESREIQKEANHWFIRIRLLAFFQKKILRRASISGHKFVPWTLLKWKFRKWDLVEVDMWALSHPFSESGRRQGSEGRIGFWVSGLNFGKHGDFSAWKPRGPGLRIHQCLSEGLFFSWRIFGNTWDGTTEMCQRKQKPFVNNVISHD